MTQGVYSIYDSKAEYYLPPFVCRSDGEAQRIFADAIAKPNTMLHEHPEDFALFRVGSFNLATGEIIAEPHKSLGKSFDFIRKDSEVIND